jgi:IS4 transposase
MDDVLMRFVDEAPIAVMVRSALEHVFCDATLDSIFSRSAERQYTKHLTFSALTRLMTKVTFCTHDSVHAAYRHSRKNQEITVSIAAVYDKLGGLESATSEAMVCELGQRMSAIIEALPRKLRDPVPGLRLKTLDGNFLAGTDHRLKCLRGCGAAALPGMSLVVRDGRTGLLTNLIAREDAYTNERSLYQQVLELVERYDLWLADRNFCTEDYLAGFVVRKAYFLVRYHAGAKLVPLGKARSCGSNDTGKVFEQQVRVGSVGCRCLIIHLHKPLRDGSTEIRLLTNVPPSKANAKCLAKLYRTRWTIETAFQELTENLRCEVRTLGYPKAALFAFALAVVAYNVLVVVKAALASAHSRKKVDTELSGYHLATEVAVVSEGLDIAVPGNTWRRFAEMTTSQFARWLHQVAKHAPWDRYRKNPRGPKKPQPIQRTRRGAHRSTARLLKEQDARRARQKTP